MLCANVLRISRQLLQCCVVKERSYCTHKPLYDDEQMLRKARFGIHTKSKVKFGKYFPEEKKNSIRDKTENKIANKEYRKLNE